MPDLNFNSLLADNSRESDQFVNATAWCQKFGKRWAEFDRLPETKKFIRACCENKQVPKKVLIHSVKGSCTWVHPEVAVELFRWIQKGERRKLSDLLESSVRDHLASKINGSKTEVVCKSGIVDILTYKHVIEVKTAKSWKAAVGQALVYSLEFPDRLPRIHLYDSGSQEFEMMVISFCNQLGVSVSFHSDLKELPIIFSPNQARAIAYSKDYQTELPIC